MCKIGCECCEIFAGGLGEPTLDAEINDGRSSAQSQWFPPGTLMAARQSETSESSELEALFPQWLRDAVPGLDLGGRKTSHAGMLFNL